MFIIFFILAIIVNRVNSSADLICVTSGTACDYRCHCCMGRGNTSDDCSACVIAGSVQSNGFIYYMAVDSNGLGTGSCATTCPQGQYINTNAVQMCANCDANCSTCTGPSNENCTSCSSISFSLNTTKCYNRPASSNSYSTYNPCPDPYYGWPLTMVCLPCTTGCASCSIALQYLMPLTYRTSKTMSQNKCLDSTCSQTLKCYSCKPNYSLVQYFCLPNNQCRQYAVYTSDTIQFNPNNCNCLPYYYMTGYMSCSRCNIKCYTCSQDNDASCLSCPDGASLSSTPGSCTYNSTFTQIQNWSNKTANDQLIGNKGSFSTNANAIFTTGCSVSNNVRYLFGCDASGICQSQGVLTYSASNLLSHYGIRIIFSAVFVDAWPSSGTLFVKNKIGTEWVDSFSYNYNSHGVVGQFLCNKNILDIVEVIDGWWPHTTNNLDFTIQSNSQILPNYYWGMRQLIIMKMNCHSSCTTCSGPTASDCTSCPEHQTVFNFSCIYGDILFCYTPSPVGKCVCDINNHYYLDKNGLCQSANTTSTYIYKNNNTRQFVSTCPIQMPFADTLTFFCVQTCDKGETPTYKNYEAKTCVDTCNIDTTTIAGNYYKFDGNDPQCVQICPSGTVADTFSYKCTSQCSSGYFSFLDSLSGASGYFCDKTCPTSPLMQYAYNGTGTDPGQCLLNCPNGYFKNNKSGIGICESICSVSYGGTYLYGSNATGSCVNNCPPGSYADLTTNLCLMFCNLTQDFYNQLIGSIGTCVKTCISVTLTGLFGNPQTGFCVNSSNCPSTYYGDPNHNNRLCVLICNDTSNDYYYGDNTTKLCQKNCTSGFKYNGSKICVAICPTPLFGDTYSQFCVTNCPTDNSGGYQYADVQQNMQCVSTCSDGITKGVTPTFGANETFTCVINCTATELNTWGDTKSNRLCVTDCTFNPSYKSYGYDNLGLCVTNCPYSWFGASPTITGTVSLCVKDCSFYGFYYGDVTTNTCVSQCPSNYYASRSINLGICAKYCQSGFANSTSNLCNQDCPSGLADIVTRTCVNTNKSCSIGYYGNDTSHTCAIVNTSSCKFADNYTQSCVAENQCTLMTNWASFSDSSTGYCVFICPNYTDSALNGLFGDNLTGKCTDECTLSQIADPQNLRRCVGFTSCSKTPLILYGNSVKKMCVTPTQCQPSTFADNYTYTCNMNCQGPILIFGDPISRQCVSLCPSLSWGILQNGQNYGICNTTCNIGFADNSTRLCTMLCAANTYGIYYDDSGYIYGICETSCIKINNSSAQKYYTRDIDNLCVINCSDNGISKQLYGNPLTGNCISNSSDCPFLFYGSDFYSLCVQPQGCELNFFADNYTKKCVLKCPEATSNIALNYGDPQTKMCVSLCPSGTFGQNTTLQCMSSCPTSTYADFQIRICVAICSNYPLPTFGENIMNTCVLAKNCPPNYFGQNIVTNQTCVQNCFKDSVPNSLQQYADNVTKLCVTVCSNGYYGRTLKTGSGICVTQCGPLSGETTTYANNSTQTCVVSCPNGTYADPTTYTCVNVCPPTYFAQASTGATDNLCVKNCTTNTFAEFITRSCITNASNCPIVNGNKQYSDTTNNSCVSQCSSESGFWGENSTWTCVQTCITGFKWNLTRVCINICPADPNGTGSFSDQGMCYPVCITTGFYMDIQKNRSCTLKCSITPILQYADDTTWSCVLKCPSQPSMYYAYNGSSKAVCITTCPNYTNSNTQSCVLSCPVSTFIYPTTNFCLAQCPTDTPIVYFGNSFLSSPTCTIASNCSPNFADTTTGLCVISCPANTNLYIPLNLCVYKCPAGYYTSSTGICQDPSGCNNLKQFADNVSLSCVSVCSNSFGDPTTYFCVDKCPTNYYANPITNLCSKVCTSNSTSVTLIINTNLSSCVSNCSFNTYYDVVLNKCVASCTNSYADPTTNICVSTCPTSPPLYAQSSGICVSVCNVNEFMDNNTRKCVTTCGSLYFDKVNYYCVSTCIDPYYSDPNSKSCVLNCTSKYFSLQTTSNRTCVVSCTYPYYADSTTMRCVLQCPVSPKAYYKQNSTSSCVQNCTGGLYADPSTFTCVSTCPLSPLLIGYNATSKCVTICPNENSNLYALLTTRVCVSSCPKGLFAQNFTKTCTNQCTNGTNTYADNLSTPPSCVYNCSASQFGDPVSLSCLSVCPSAPKTYGYNNGTNRICVSLCPPTYVTDNFTNQCVQNCLSAAYPYLDYSVQSCVAVCSSNVNLFGYISAGQSYGICVTSCPSGYADELSRTCLLTCPKDYYGQTTNKTCVSNCSLANSNFADSTTNLCVKYCPSNYYADNSTRSCVKDCPQNINSTNINSYGYINITNNNRICVTQCPLNYYADLKKLICVQTCPSKYFADNVTQTCVNSCSLYTLTYSNQSVCLSSCPSPLYANDQNRSCVFAGGCQSGYFSDDNTRRCTEVCTGNTFGYINNTSGARICLTDCPSNYYRDSTTFMCVLNCPKIPYLYADNLTKNCVLFCSSNYYASNDKQNCVRNCSSETYADPTTFKCVSTCPYIPTYYYRYNATWTCVTNCLGSTYSDNISRSCVSVCPLGTYGYNNTCVLRCPNSSTISTYGENSICVTYCIIGFADNISRYCVSTCPQYYYANNITKKCVKSCQPLYGQDIINQCMSNCTNSTFADPITFLCVKVCWMNTSITYYADTTTKSCVKTCSSNYYADPSTQTCVLKCPSTPSLYGHNKTCLSSCPSNTYAQNNTRNCLPNCSNTNPITYADNNTWSCVSICSSYLTYSTNVTYSCVSTCPNKTFADNSTRSCVTVCKQNNTFGENITYTCVSTCPVNYFAENLTKLCVKNCPNGTFADQLLYRCVAICSIDPVYYGDPNQNTCVPQCPSNTNSFGNPLTQQCVKSTGSLSGCPNLYFSDSFSRLCVLQCPYSKNTFANNATQKCVSSCPLNSFADNSTMICVAVCPTYPSYYGEGNVCVQFCDGTFADNTTRLCVNDCPAGYFADNSTSRCVLYCPPVSFADNSTNICVANCPDSPDYFGDLSSLTCVFNCPGNTSTFFTYADSNLRLCVKICGNNSNNIATYGENITKTCLSQCPSGSYADNNTYVCVAACPKQPPTYSDNTTNTCVTICPIQGNYFANLFQQTCVLQCPSSPLHTQIRTYADNSTRKCLLNCPFNLFTYADNITSTCVTKCPQGNSTYKGTYGDDTTKTCVFQCPFIPFLYAQNTSRTCVANCENGFAENNSRICVLNCPNGSYANSLNNICVELCPIDYFAYKINNTCLVKCPQPYFADNTTRTCVKVCPISQLLFGETNMYICMYNCPINSYADLSTQRCVKTCPSKTFAQNITYLNQIYGKCVNQCNNTLFGYDGPAVDGSKKQTNICLSSCPDPYYMNIQDNLCHKCPQLCASCNNQNYCTKCINYTNGTKAFLYSNICYQTCPTIPVITYANNATLTCGTNINCSSGLYASNISKSCVSTCENGTYQNSVQQTCDNCVKYCNDCKNYSSCLECDSKYALWSNYSCFPYCSRLAKNYYGSGCVADCPVGTYLNLTSCATCDATCLSCIGQATNCIKCNNGLYLQNHICTYKCSADTKATNLNGTLICRSCKEPKVNCKTNLTFTVQQLIKDYQYRIYIIWSSKITVIGSIADAIVLSISNSRLLLSNLSYSIVDQGNGIFEFIVNNINASTTAGLQFQVQVVNPSAITSQNGDIPSITVANVVIPASVIYDLSNYNKNFYNYSSFVTIITILFIFILFWTKGQIWMQVIDTLQMLYVLYFINITLPPTPNYMLGSFKLSFFSFLPSMFTNSLPKPIVTTDTTSAVYSLIGDFMFLRNQGYLFSILIIIVVLVIVILVLIKSKSIIKNTEKRHAIKKYWKQILLGQYFHNFIYLFYLPTIFFAFFQMRNYKLYYPIVGFSIFSSLVFLLLFLAVPIYFSIKLYKFIKKYPFTFETLGRAYNFIIKEPIFLVQNQQNKFSFEKNNIDLKDLTHPKINQKLILPYAIETNMDILGVTQPLINYLYKTLIGLFMAVSFNNPLAQLLLLIILNLIYLIIILASKPYFYKKGDYFIKNWLLICNMILLMVIQILMVIFATTYQKLQLSVRLILGDAIAYIVLILITINFIYLCLRVYEEFYYKVWRPFVYSQCFKQNYPYQHHSYIQQYEKQKELLYKNMKKRKRKALEKQAIIQKNLPTLDVKITKDNDMKATLRPTFHQKLNNQTKGIENQFYKKQRSVVSKSNTLSRMQRMKMLNMIFAQSKLQQHEHQQKFEVLDVKKRREGGESSSEKSSQQLIGVKLKTGGRIEEDDQYEYEYIEQEYSEDANIHEILGENFKGDIIIS